MPESNLLDRINGKLHEVAESKRVFFWVILISFCEATFLPVPLEAILIPLMYSCRRRIWTFSLAATIGCLLGASVGYLIGAAFFESMSVHIANMFGSPEQLEQVMMRIRQDGFMFVFATGVTPVPLQLATLGAGAVQFSFALFLLAVTLSRVIRYFGLGALVYFFGPLATDIIKRYKYQVASVLSLGFILLFISQFVSI